MRSEKPIVVRRDCEAVMIPSGEKITLSRGSTVWLTQSLGGSYTVMTDRGYMARIEGRDGDTIGESAVAQPQTSSVAPAALTREQVANQVWEQLRTCFDPEIPVNIVDLGLIYGCEVTQREGEGYKAQVKFTLTAQGCGMGQFLKRDIQNKLAAIPGIEEVDVQLVWDPPWNQSMISHGAKQQLGIE
jgi:probable FeS assembly SUF system protein SufT